MSFLPTCKSVEITSCSSNFFDAQIRVLASIGASRERAPPKLLIQEYKIRYSDFLIVILRCVVYVVKDHAFGDFKIACELRTCDLNLPIHSFVHQIVLPAVYTKCMTSLKSIFLRQFPKTYLASPLSSTDQRYRSELFPAGLGVVESFHWLRYSCLNSNLELVIEPFVLETLWFPVVV